MNVIEKHLGKKHLDEAAQIGAWPFTSWTGFSGTGGRIGELKNVKYNKLTRAFGKPGKFGSPDGKTQVEWFIEIDNVVKMRIYDYKSDVPPEKNTRWSVGSSGPGGGRNIIKMFLRAYGFDMLD